jgi:hypothetical protein
MVAQIQSLLANLDIFLQKDLVSICGPQRFTSIDSSSPFERPRQNQHIGVEFDDNRLKLEVCACFALGFVSYFSIERTTEAR